VSVHDLINLIISHNFNVLHSGVKHLQEIINAGMEVPAVNQIEVGHAPFPFLTLV